MRISIRPKPPNPQGPKPRIKVGTPKIRLAPPIKGLGGLRA